MMVHMWIEKNQESLKMHTRKFSVTETRYHLQMLLNVYV